MPDGFKFALQFLTRLSFGKHLNYQPELAAAAVTWYAPVGLVIGCICAFTAWIMAGWLQLPAPLVAALILVTWVVVTGALHLDGVGDCGDAWMGGHTPERMLEIMKDTQCGIGAIVSVGLVLLVKYAALVLLVEQNNWIVFIVAPAIARSILTLVIVYLPYVRPNGLATSMQSNIDAKAIMVTAISLWLLFALICFDGFLYSLIACVIGFLMIYFSLIKPLKGATGDVYGTLVEVCEAAALIGLVAAI